jgi:prepilin-type N-terminal cleavage/methylation domain-containing protein
MASGSWQTGRHGAGPPNERETDPVLQRFRKIRSDQSGFTLTELLIVIVILGVLTGIVVFAVGAFNDRGKTAACKSDRKAVEVAVEAYYAKTGGYPADVDALVTAKYLREPPTTGNGYTISLAAGGVVNSNPVDCVV